MKKKLLALAVLVPSLGHADVKPDHVNPVQPVLKLEGSSSGKAQLKIGLDLTVPTDADSDFTFAPLFSPSTNAGLSDVLSFDSNTATARDFTLALQFDSITLEHLKDTTDSDHSAQVKRFQACVSACKPTSNDPFCDAVNIDALNRLISDAGAPLDSQAIENLVLKNVSDAATADTTAATKLFEEATKAAADAAKQVKDGNDEITKLTVVRATAKREDQGAADAALGEAKRHLADLRQQSDQREEIKKALENRVVEAKAISDKAAEALRDGEKKADDLRRKKKRLDDRASAAKKFAKKNTKPIDEDTASPDMLCADGVKEGASASKVARDKRLERPHMILSGGLVVGHSSFKFLQANAEGFLAPTQDTKNNI